MRKMMTTDDAKPSSRQHKQPCSDCPYRRDAIPGWLGGSTPEEYALLAHGEAMIMCHTKRGPQCAGAAIYRANVCKNPRTPDHLRLPEDTVKVFSSMREFIDYHSRSDKA